MSASGDFGPAPAGIDLSENQDGDIFGPVVALMVVSSIFIITRFVTRILSRQGGVSLDDYLILVGWFFTTGTAMCCLISTNYGCGRHLWVLTTTEFEVIFKVSSFTTLFYPQTTLLIYNQDPLLIRLSLRLWCNLHQALNSSLLPSSFWCHSSILGMSGSCLRLLGRHHDSLDQRLSTCEPFLVSLYYQ